ncbi:hypothetical protein CEXT_275651 [Caerostris extrusa]|uniref:Uncharacterized protein n=1 Tax=Caerostris extrusa TaxID=172846 RepID=A0AAV4NMP5_CAEEX|nr:hypothetical protein CEXT_275651 [Caerostris extrusa]
MQNDYVTIELSYLKKAASPFIHVGIREDQTWQRNQERRKHVRIGRRTLSLFWPKTGGAIFPCIGGTCVRHPAGQHGH